MAAVACYTTCGFFFKGQCCDGPADKYLSHHTPWESNFIGHFLRYFHWHQLSRFLYLSPIGLFSEENFITNVYNSFNCGLCDLLIDQKNKNNYEGDFYVVAFYFISITVACCWSISLKVIKKFTRLNKQRVPTVSWTAALSQTVTNPPKSEKTIHALNTFLRFKCFG